MATSMHEALVAAFADLPEASSAIPKLVRHWDLLVRWAKRINLTSIDSIEDAAWLHYRDSLEVLRLWPGGTLLDVGSGAGFPGVPLAIARPDAQVTLLEPRRKRVSFLEVTRAELGLQNLSVICGRIEDVPPRLFDTIVTRATFSSTQDLLRCLDWATPGSKLIALRSGEPSEGAERVHRYSLRGSERLLEVWSR